MKNPFPAGGIWYRAVSTPAVANGSGLEDYDQVMVQHAATAASGTNEDGYDADLL
jgi:hypothetical protein